MGKLYFLISLPVFILVFAFGDTATAASNYQVVPNYTDPVTPPTVYIRPSAELQEQCTDCTFTAYRLVRQLNCGAAEAIQDPGEKPTCSLVPRVTVQGAIELTWDTAQANVAFIGKGVGHVSPGYGSRIITPTTTTEYNMTVINRGGLVNNCSARVEVTPVDTDPAGLGPITPPELDITVPGEPGAQTEGWLLLFIKAWWWLIGIILAAIYFVYNKVKGSLGI